MKKELPIFSLWSETLSVIFDVCGRFPRNVRPTLGARLVERSIDVLEGIIELRYNRDRRTLFDPVNLSIEKLRVLVRIAFERRLISGNQYRQLAEGIDGCGRMLGAWKRSAATGKRRR